MADNTAMEEEEGDFVLDIDIESLKKQSLEQESDIVNKYPLPVSRVISWYPCVTERYYKPYFYVPSNDLHNQMAIKSTGHHVVSDQCILFHSNRVAVITLSPHHPVLKYELPIESISFSGGRKTDRLANKVSGKRKHGGQQLVESSVICTLKCRTRSSTSSCSPSSTGLKSCLTPSSSSPSAGELMPKTCLELKSELGKEDQSLEQQSLDPGLSESPNRSISNFINPSRSSDDDANNRKGDADTKSLSDNGSMEDESMFTYYPIVAGMKGTLVEVNEKLISNPHLIVNEPWSSGYIAIVLTKIHQVNLVKHGLLEPTVYADLVSKRDEKELEKKKVGTEDK